MPAQVDIYSRSGCHLCEIALETAKALQSETGAPKFIINEIDIDSDPELKAKYSDKVPVTYINQKLFSYYGINENEFRAALKIIS